MSVKTTSLDTPERDLDLTTRDPKVRVKDFPGGQLMIAGTPTAEDELLALRQRITDALAVTPKDSTPHCGDCYRRGWNAALLSLKE